MSNQNLFRFRELRPEDALKLYEFYSDSEAMRYRGTKPMQTAEDAVELIKNQNHVTGESRTIRLGVELLESNTLIGTIMKRYKLDEATTCEIGYSIGKNYWGNSYGKQILAQLVRELKAEGKVTELTAGSYRDNIASIKVLEHNGFQRVASEEENPAELNYMLSL